MTIHMKHYVREIACKMYIFSRKFNTNFILLQTCQNIFKLTVKTNHYITVCVTPAKIGITDGIKRQNIIYM